jgi:hypothetical protein
MILFFQFDILVEFELPFQIGSHLSIFMCPEHNEIPSFDQFHQLPVAYWDKTEGHWYATLSKPCSEVQFASPQFLQPAKLVMSNSAKNHWSLSVGGEPLWLQDPEQFACACGSDMHFVCQLSDGFQFPKLSEAPEQPDSSSADDYVLFLGNEVYVFACPNQCNPRAVWVTVQN